MLFNGRVVVQRSLELEGVDRRDYPDFCDAYFSYAEYEDGTPLNDEELEELTEEYDYVLNEMAHDSLH
jgi:hypothetical protein